MKSQEVFYVSIIRILCNWAGLLGDFWKNKDISSNLIGQIRFFFTMAVKHFPVENCS